MSIKYSLFRQGNPMKPAEPMKVYARSQVRDEVDLTRIATEIADASSLTEGDVLNTLSSLIRVVRQHMADGDMVSLGDLGKFRYLISSAGAESAEAFNTSYIRRVRIQYLPSRRMTDGLSQLTFERTLSVKEKAAARKAASDGSLVGGED